MGIFSRKKKLRGGDVERIADPPVWEQSWQRKRLPDPGAENYAFLNLDLPPFTQIGAGVAVRHPYRVVAMGPQSYFPKQHTALQGIGQVSGSFVSQPLFNPLYPTYGAVSPLTNNDAMPRSEIQPAGAIIT